MSGIVVGVDGSEESIAALRFAVEEAALRNAGVLAIYALDVPIVAWPGLTPLVGKAMTEANLMLGDAIEEAFGKSDQPAALEREVVEKRPSEALVEASVDADLLVVGSRGHGGFAGLVLGSVGHQCAQHASCPVAIVRRPAHAEPGTILVGLDGSDESKRALRFADEEARLRGARLVAIHAHAPTLVGPGLLPVAVPIESSAAETEAFLHALVVEVLGEARASNVEQRVVSAGAAAALTQSASADDLVVVGSRGHGGFAGLLLGSVSQQVAHHAPCPVVIVRRRAQ